MVFINLIVKYANIYFLNIFVIIMFYLIPSNSTYHMRKQAIFKYWLIVIFDENNIKTFTTQHTVHTHHAYSTPKTFRTLPIMMGCFDHHRKTLYGWIYGIHRIQSVHFHNVYFYEYLETDGLSAFNHHIYIYIYMFYTIRALARISIIYYRLWNNRVRTSNSISV